MKRIVSTIGLLVALVVTSWAQSLCRVSVTFSGLRGPDKDASLTVFRVLLNGAAYSNKREVFRVNSSGVLLGADGAPGLQLPQGAVVWLYANANAIPLIGLDSNPNSGTPYQVPNKSSATIYELQGATTLFRALGDLVYGGVDGLPARLPAGANGKILKMVGGIPTWATESGGGGGSSDWGGIGGTLADQLDLKAALDAKAALSHAHVIGDVTGLQAALDAKAAASSLAAVATSGSYNDLLNLPTLGTAASRNVAASGDASSTEVVKGNDSRLTDARTPISHSHIIADVTGLQTALDGKQATGNYLTGLTGDVSASGPGSVGATLATVNSSPGAFGSASKAVSATVNGKGLITGLSEQNIAIAENQVTNLVSDLAAKAAASLVISVGNGLSGAGDLSANRTIDLRLNSSGGLDKTLGVGTNELGIAAGGVTAAMLAGSISDSKLNIISTAGKVADSALSANVSLLGSSIDLSGAEATGILAGGRFPAMSGDISNSAGSLVTAIGTNKVTNSMLAQMASHTFKGNNTGSTANALDLTATQLTAELNVFGASLKGLVPAAAASPDATKFLNEAGAFAVPTASVDQTATYAWTGPHSWAGVAVNHKRDGIGTTNATGIELSNNTAATVGVQQQSPDLIWTGSGWKTTATAAAQTVNFRAYALPVQGAANPTATWVLQSQVNGSGYTTRLTVDSSGTVSASGGVNVVQLGNGGPSAFLLSSGGLQLSSSGGLGISGSGVYTSNDIWWDRTAAATWRLRGSTTTTAATLGTPPNTPAQITADQNNYAPGTGWFQRWSSDASRTVTGLVAGQAGDLIEIWNVGSQNIVLANESASSTAANRFTTTTGADLTLSANKCAEARYDNTSARWRVRLCN